GVWARRDGVQRSRFAAWNPAVSVLLDALRRRRSDRDAHGIDTAHDENVLATLGYAPAADQREQSRFRSLLIYGGGAVVIGFAIAAWRVAWLSAPSPAPQRAAWTTEPRQSLPLNAPIRSAPPASTQPTAAPSNDRMSTPRNEPAKTPPPSATAVPPTPR